MNTFFQWCEEKNLELPEISENTKRTGLSFNYPDAYVRGQYPKDHYFNAIKATAEIDKVNKPRSVPNNQH